MYMKLGIDKIPQTVPCALYFLQFRADRQLVYADRFLPSLWSRPDLMKGHPSGKQFRHPRCLFRYKKGPALHLCSRRV